MQFTLFILFQIDFKKYDLTISQPSTKSINDVRATQDPEPFDDNTTYRTEFGKKPLTKVNSKLLL